MAKVIQIKRFDSEYLSGLLDRFNNHLYQTDRGRTARIYVGDAKRFAEWIADRYEVFDPAAVSPLDIIEYRRYLQDSPGRPGRKENKTAGTVNRILISLRVFFGWMVKTGQIQMNPMEGIKPVAVSGIIAPKWLDRRQQAALIHTVQGKGKLRDIAIIGIMLHAGLRISEVCGLNRNNIKITERTGSVNVTGKGNKVRIVPLNKTVRKMISNWLKANPEGPLWPNRYGKPIGQRGVFKMFAEYAYHAKIKDVSPHTLRHTFCKNLIDQGVPIDQVAVLAGHSSLDTTKRYTAPSMADLQAAVDRTAWE